jgi:hypothetical protein
VIARIPLRARDGSVRAWAIVDADIVASLGEWRWCLSSDGYAKRTPRVDGRRVVIYLHRLVADAKPGEDVDHINRDRLDCRRANLRVGTRALNLQNVASRGGTSRHRGVSWHRGAGRWRATVKLAGKAHHLGLFDDEERAAEAAIAFRAEHMDWAEAA